MLLKAIAGSLKLDGAKEGTFRAVIATLNALDSDNDVTLPGAFKAGETVRVAQSGHNWGLPTIGSGKLDADQKQAWIDGTFNLKMAAGREHYESVKFDAETVALQEWSYGYDVLDSEVGQYEGKDARFLKALKVIEVSPVMLGAGVDTRTEMVKGMKFADHAAVLLADMDAFLTRARDLKALRAKEGRTLSDANRTRLSSLMASMDSGLTNLRALLEETAPRTEEQPKELDLAMLRLQEMRDDARRLGITA